MSQISLQQMQSCADFAFQIAFFCSRAHPTELSKPAKTGDLVHGVTGNCPIKGQRNKKNLLQSHSNTF